MPLLETKGAASAQGFGGAGAGASGLVTYIEDVFSTYLYTGNGSTQTITNGIDLSTKGGLVWIKGRTNTFNHFLRSNGIGDNYLSSNTTASATDASSFSYVNSTTGFSITTSQNILNGTGNTYVSWTFRKQPKFFDIVTYTGNGTGDRTISHNLGSVPGCIIVKRYDTAEVWQVFHRSINAGRYGFIRLDSTNAANTSTGYDWNPTSTTFVADNDLNLNFMNGTYVAYLFAHNAGGFGLTGTDNVISCGSFTTGTSGKISAPVNLGYEVQWLLVKNTDASENWQIYDVMRGMPVSNGIPVLYPNLSDAEYFGPTSSLAPTATGFDTPTAAGPFANSSTYIYIAIRRGPMKVPTSGTSVYTPVATSGSGNYDVDAGFPIDWAPIALRGGTQGPYCGARLTGANTLTTSSTAAEIGGTPLFNGNGTQNNVRWVSAVSANYINWLFRRAPGFFDVVCYTGTGSATTFNHNLGAVPELMIFKTRTGAARAWGVYSSAFGVNKKLVLNTTAAVADDPYFVNATPTTTVFYPGNANESNEGGNTYVAYLFATCPGVSKVGTYTGTGALQTINCGFTGGARFVLIKRTDSTGDWYVYDSARGISSGNDPYLFLNSTAAEVTGTNYVDTDSTGFKVTAAAPAGLNANGGSFVFLAIA